MTLSPEGAKTLKRREGFLAESAPDADGYAIGYGMQTWQGKKVGPGFTTTQADSDVEFDRQIREERSPLVDRALKIPVTQAQYDALVSLAYNHPATAKAVIEKLNRGEHVTIDDFLKSATVKGKPHPGLENRRREEFAPFERSQ